jgi:CRP-like cAMP-binding protein
MSEAKSLRELPALAGMADALLEGLSRAMVFENRKDGYEFSRAGRAGKRAKDALHLLVEGQVHVSTTPQSTQQVPVERLLHRGEMFGLITFLKGGAHTASTRAVGPVKVATLDRNRYEQAIQTDPALNSALLFAIASQLARDVRACNERLLHAIARSDPRQAR